jgi:sulfite reductase alpha subunit-like flavoprotein
MSKDTVCILYGSQTGNAESITKILHEEIINKTKISSTYDTLNNACNICFNNVKYLIVICSTTGNGDMPDNSVNWWRQFKQRTTHKETFEGINFIVLALGNSNYSKFCYCGNTIDKRLAELSGKRIMELTCVDDATDMDESVEIWINKVIVVLQHP